MIEPSPDTTTTEVVGAGQLGADAGRQAITHGAQAARGQMGARMAEAAVLGHPHLVLAHVAGHDKAVVHHFRHVLSSNGA